MCAESIRVALATNAPSWMSGGVDRLLKLVEFSGHGSVSYTLILTSNTAAPEAFTQRVRDLKQDGLLEIVESTTAAGPRPDLDFDVVVIPTEYWLQPLRRTQKMGVRGPVGVEFQLLPFLGSLDSVSLPDIERLPIPVIVKTILSSSRVNVDWLPSGMYRTLACRSYLKRLAGLREVKVMAISE